MVLTFLSEFWVVSPEVPVAAIHSFLDMGLSDAHTLADTVVDARSVSDDEGWTWYASASSMALTAWFMLRRDRSVQHKRCHRWTA